MSFQLIPVIDLSRAFDPATKPQFLAELHHALINVGFLLLKNWQPYGPSDLDFVAIKEQGEAFFALPLDVKRKGEMIHLPHFLGYSRLANEITALHTDWREQIDLATELPEPEKDLPIYRQIEGPNLWPDESLVPLFRPVVTNYITKMTELSQVFRRLVCEAIGLPANAFDAYFKPNQQCKMKIISYPDSALLESAESEVLSDTPETRQGCGPHRDSDLLTYIYQASGSGDALQVQNFQGQWIPVPNVAGTLVVNAGQTLEAITSGVCKATIHRVITPAAGSGTRISVPFFQTIDLDAHKAAVDAIPAEVVAERDARDAQIKDWGVDVGFQFTPDVAKHPVGHAVFRNRIKSHQDVAQRWYPEILKEVLQQN